jgi:exodeoxyribonuclease VII large subunit
VVIYPSPVQGAEAPAALVRALQLAGARGEVQTLLLVRGGGSLEDLWAFNDERLVRAVAACPLPVICGVGHETDITLCDLAADLRAPTPTAAAELAALARVDALALLETRADDLTRRLRRALDKEAQRLDTVALRLQRPAASLAGHGQRLQAAAARLRTAALQQMSRQALQPPALAERLQRAAQVQVQRQQQRLAGATQRLDALDPRQVLRRGYAWVEDGRGRPVLSVHALAVGQTVQAVWADGRASAQVQSVDADGHAHKP